MAPCYFGAKIAQTLTLTQTQAEEKYYFAPSG